MSKIEVNTVEPQCGTTLTLGASGDTVTIPSGATISNLGTAAGFGSTGEVSWDTTVKTTSFTATSGSGFFVNTAGGAVTVTLPASPSAGNVVAVSDYNSTAATNNITIARNSSNINGTASNLVIEKANSAVQLVYVDSTTGWQNVTTASTSDFANAFVEATGGTITTCGDYKIHTFTGPGTFTVTSGGTSAGSNTVSYLVQAGGGGGGGGLGGGGGAGGFREGKASSDCYTASPLNAPAGLPVSAQAYPITVGGGGAGRATPNGNGVDGSNSVFSTITSAGGGGGGTVGTPPNNAGASGGSGGGGAGQNPSSNPGAGNTPPVSPPQGNNGGVGDPSPGYFGGGGGGATASGNPGTTPSTPGKGGAGATSSINGTPTARGGGGSGGGDGPGQPGGAGGGGKAGNNPEGNGSAGTTNTGGGGGGGSGGGPTGGDGAAGGSGIVIIRYKFQ